MDQINYQKVALWLDRPSENAFRFLLSVGDSYADSKPVVQSESKQPKNFSLYKQVYCPDIDTNNSEFVVDINPSTNYRN